MGLADQIQTTKYCGNNAGHQALHRKYKGMLWIAYHYRSAADQFTGELLIHQILIFIR